MIRRQPFPTPTQVTLEVASVSDVMMNTRGGLIEIRQVPDRLGIASSIFAPLAEVGANLDMIVQNVSSDGLTDISFTVDDDDSFERVVELVQQASSNLAGAVVTTDRNIAVLSIRGAGFKEEPNIAATLFEALAAQAINIRIITASTVRIDAVIASDKAEAALAAVRRAFSIH
jgi:aspartate kinase